jgi:hypothetical protein
MSFKIGALKIKKTNDNSKLNLPKYVPHPNFRALICGPSECGKGYMLVYILNKIYKKAFNRRYFFSQTKAHDPTWQALKAQKNDMTFHEYNEDTLTEIVQHQKESPKRKRILIVLDDLTKADLHNSVLLNDLIRYMRHYHISIIFTVQRYNLVSPDIRSQISHMSLFNITNSKEINAIVEDIPFIDKKQFLKVYQNCMKETTHDYRPFLQVDKKRNIISKCFEHEISNIG